MGTREGSILTISVDLSRHVKKISLRGKQPDCLLYLVDHPVSSAYKIKPPSKTNESDYRWAKEAVKRAL